MAQRRLVVLAALVSAVALVATSCGGSGDGETNRAWARQFCTSLHAWQDSTTTGSDDLQTFLKTPDVDPAAAKEKLTAYLDDVRDATAQLGRGLTRAGTPAVTRGPAVARSLRQGSRAVQAAITEARAVVAAAPVDDATTFRAAVTAANTRLDQGFDAFGAALDRVNRLDRGGDLRKAERASAACRPLLAQ